MALYTMPATPPGGRAEWGSPLICMLTQHLYSSGGGLFSLAEVTTATGRPTVTLLGHITTNKQQLTIETVERLIPKSLELIVESEFLVYFNISH